MGFGNAAKRAGKVAFWFVKPGFPGLDKFNNPIMDAADLAEKMHDIKKSNDESKRIMQEAVATIDSSDIDDKTCYQLWIDALEVKQQTLDESVKRRLVVATILMLFTFYLVGWGIGVYRGLYDSIIFSSALSLLEYCFWFTQFRCCCSHCDIFIVFGV